MATNLHTFMDIFDTEFVVDDENIKIKKIVIPIIQRDYAQGRKDAEAVRVRQRFLESLYLAVTEKPITLDFVYGDIDAGGVMTPLDGQQRLTTLFLLHWYAAKIEGVAQEDYAFLKNFSYATRYSARDFCAELVDFSPFFEGEVSEEIKDQAWFPLEWEKDPTVSAMLVMLDSIQHKFSDVEGLWEKLKDKAISFYFLPVKEMGLTDELYIKMNSRGKPLTVFEHFKAELEHELKKVDADLAKRVLSKIDLQWTDLLWDFRGDDNVIDDEFLRYFRFICDIICYKSGGSMQGKYMSEFALLDEFFSSKKENVVSNVLLLEEFFDVWCMSSLHESPTDFLEKYIASTHTADKIAVGNKPNLFEDCLRNYADIYGGRNRAFPLNRIILLYAVVCYLQNKSVISEKEFIRRLRTIHNLCRNSEDEISDSEQRSSGNRMPAILKQVDSIILSGTIDDSLENNFNTYQLSEEKEKLQWTENNPELAESLYELEDHDLLYGQIAIVGLEHPEFFGKFYNLFNCNKDAIDCALLMMGDYTQRDRNGWRYQIGSKYFSKSWENLFHNSAASGFENTKMAVQKLLSLNITYSDEALYEIKENYISDCEEKGLYDWKYYYVKYESVFRPGRYGVVEWADKEQAPYEMLILYAERYPSENAYQPFLKLMDESALSRDEMGRYLIIGDYWIECANDGYYLHSMEDDELLETFSISQNEDGIDTENRVEKAKEWYKKIKEK